MFSTNIYGLVAGAMIMMAVLSGCGGVGGSSGGSGSDPGLLGNWQFTMATQTDGNPGDPTFGPGLQGGFLLQSNGSATGQAVYSVTSSKSFTGPCNAGSAPITVTISGQNVTLTAVAGTQTFTLSGTLSSDGSTMMGTYTSTAGTGADGSACGYAETGLPWSAISVPPITGLIQGSFHSTETLGGGAGLSNEDFPLWGLLTQGENIGASSATVTGTLTFINPQTNVNDYPCFAQASVNGEISGNSVILQIIGLNGAEIGQIGGPANGSTGVNPVTFDSAQGGYILHGAEPNYIVAAPGCPGTLQNKTTAGDYGNICLALNSPSACEQPITLTPATVTFPAVMLNATPTAQTITLANNSSSALSGLKLSFNYDNGAFTTPSDFNALPNFTQTDACGAGGAPSQGEQFDLGSGQACSITVTFSPQESCPWIPYGSPASVIGAPPEYCPLALEGQVTVNNPKGNPLDGDANFAVPATGIGLSAIQPSTSELDFGAEEQFNPPEASLPQILSFTNTSANPVQILGSATCVNPAKGFLVLPHDGLPGSGPVAGLQVVGRPPAVNTDILADGSTISYNCDSDSGTLLPNFQISADTCTGMLLAPQSSCSLQIAFVPQPNTDLNGGPNANNGPDYFLELNTLQCWPAAIAPSPSNPCEIDSGRFPVELTANTPSPLRMSPGAGLDFGNQAKGTTSAPMTITLLNDPNLLNPQTVSFVGRVTVQGNYAETDDCTATLVPGDSCTLTVTFKPSGAGFEPGTLTINYSPEPFGLPQAVYLRGTGH